MQIMQNKNNLKQTWNYHQVAMREVVIQQIPTGNNQGLYIIFRMIMDPRKTTSIMCLAVECLL